ncbi:MAG: rRNA maturation RNase YbeY [Bombilactobacillus mellifer]|uniref:rRNA maturation RNase YbeY n=1 Tax=Bombilactobacillus mellifer TaxID=1218492 RepID=UPI0018DDD811|nr:rRNA maturation RNase YbeY [Bombilactobacillus mellifer]MBH9990778.1 rRNA maturation RNase YbeY [Lactobacillus sp. W8092]MCT6825763.1 rRNA maturation RNase YbeY [Bombilactobacillus mellifer]MCT6843190.1 rRNA maturation RNase YbeY [Bombilactobacillus mellifer]MCT6894488.1 rRNA maturation RNase YbeY [Bombilactobacillus mellifer]
MDVEIYDQNNLIQPVQLQLVQQLIAQTATTIALPADTEMSITFCQPDKIQQLNRQYRATDRPTDVISFALEDGDDDGISTTELEAEFGVPRNIGDLFICPAVVRQHAQEYGHSYERELGYTVVHGMLHLAGYDHVQTTAAQEMFALQEKILTALGLKR